MTTFATTFRAIVCPDLARMCRSRGLFVALGMDDWSEAYDELMAVARARGACHLPDAMLFEFEDWLSAELLRAVDAAQPTIERALARFERQCLAQK